jgi:hypothetical protein
VGLSNCLDDTFGNLNRLTSQFHFNLKVDTIYCHKPGESRIIYEVGAEQDVVRRLARARQSGESEHTMLTCFFQRMQQIRNSPEDAHLHNLTYVEFPKHFRWDKQKKNWFLRKRQGRKPDIVRLGTVSAYDKELLVDLIVMFLCKY